MHNLFNFKMGRLKTSIGLLIIKENNLTDSFIEIKKILNYNDGQTYAYIMKLLDRDLVEIDSDNFNLRLTQEGKYFLKESNMLKVTLNNLFTDNRIDIDYNLNIKNYIPNKVDKNNERR